MTTLQCEVAVVGGGPAGLAAAAAVGGAGCSVMLLDAGPRLGGQYWRHPAAGLDAVRDLHHDLGSLERLLERVTASVRVLSGHAVWSVDRADDGFVARAVHAGGEVTVRSRALVLAPGAYDRQLPFPGWDLPGVMTAGGAQALMKGSEVLAGREIVVAGTGPFLLPVAAGLAKRGARVVGVFEANSPLGWLSEARTVMAAGAKLGEALSYAGALVRHGVPYRPRHAVIAAHGTSAVESVTVARLAADWSIVPGSEWRIACDTVAVGWGFTPQLELPLSLGVRSRVDVDGSLVVSVDDRQAASVPGVFVAGEATGVGGASLAVVEGEIAGRAAAGFVVTGFKVAGFKAAGLATSVPEQLRRRRRALRGFAVAMHRAHPVRDAWRSWLTEDTLVCRCEEVPVAGIQEAVHDLGASDARSTKLLSRVGMGWCQGRVCGYAASCLVAAEAETCYDPRGFAERPIAVPVSLGVLAAESEPSS